MQVAENVSFGLVKVFGFFEDCFQNRTHRVTDKALAYLKGLFKSEKKRANCQFIANSLDQYDHQSLNHLISNSTWKHESVFKSLVENVSSRFTNDEPIGLLLDEVGFVKKGRNSACVGRQYLGCIGKHDNGQVAVVAGLNQGKNYCPVSAELFMPKSWENDSERRKKAGIPDHINHRTKPQMALELILSLKEKNVKFDFVGFDALYGSCKYMIDSLNDNGILFIGDIKEDMNVFLKQPEFKLDTEKRGRKRKYPKIKTEPITVRDYKANLETTDWQQISFRKGSKSKVKASFHAKKIWFFTDNNKGKIIPLTLLIRKDTDGKTKYSLTNMCDLELLELAKRQGQRVFVEKIFEDGKNQMGMGDYQVRSWNGFHKHMAICFIGLFYMFYQKIEHEKELPLTAPIIRMLVAATIKSKWDNINTAIYLALELLNKYYLTDLKKSEEDWLT